MKCSKCGYVARTLAGMAAHYRKKHPAAMKRGKERAHRVPRGTGKAGYCPHCGVKL